MDERYNQVQAGWSVHGSDADKIGDIEEVGRDYLLVTKGLIFKTDLYVPFNAITQVDPSEGRVHLSVPKSQVDEMGWGEPPVMSGSMTGTAAGTGGTYGGSTPPPDDTTRGSGGPGYTGTGDTTDESWESGRTPVGAGSGSSYQTSGRTDLGDTGVSRTATGTDRDMYGDRAAEEENPDDELRRRDRDLG